MKGSMQEIEKQLQEHLGDPKGAFDKTYTFPKLEVKYTIPFNYRKKNPDGSMQKKLNQLPVTMSYNPFTGEKLDTEK